jgi:hypothetical protein
MLRVGTSWGGGTSRTEVYRRYGPAESLCHETNALILGRRNVRRKRDMGREIASLQIGGAGDGAIALSLETSRHAYDGPGGRARAFSP